MASVRLEGVGKRFGTTHVVRDVNLSIPDREFLVFLGPSGCGKTTTLRMIAGLESATEGTIRIGDRDVSDLPPKDRDIAMVFQNYALYPHMTVFENIAFSLRARKVPRAEVERRVEAAAEVLGLTAHLKSRPKELSGGQRQRVALGRAIVRQPAAFLMDEPLSNLDAKLRAQTRMELKRLHEEIGGTTIYVTHDQVEAMTMGMRVVVMKDGVVQQVDTPEGIYQRPVSMFVAGFVGTPAINLLRARIDRAGVDPVLIMGGQHLRATGRTGECLRGWAGEEVVVGVRPEDVHLDRHFLSEHAEAMLKAEVSIIELMGHEKIVSLSLGSLPITARTSNDWTRGRGEAVSIALDLERTILFNPETEQALSPTGRRGDGAG